MWLRIYHDCCKRRCSHRGRLESLNTRSASKPKRAGGNGRGCAQTYGRAGERSPIQKVYTQVPVAVAGKGNGQDPRRTELPELLQRNKQAERLTGPEAALPHQRNLRPRDGVERLQICRRTMQDYHANWEAFPYLSNRAGRGTEARVRRLDGRGERSEHAGARAGDTAS